MPRPTEIVSLLCDSQRQGLPCTVKGQKDGSTQAQRRHHKHKVKCGNIDKPDYKAVLLYIKPFIVYLSCEGRSRLHWIVFVQDASGPHHKGCDNCQPPQATEFFICNDLPAQHFFLVCSCCTARLLRRLSLHFPGMICIFASMRAPGYRLEASLQKFQGDSNQNDGEEERGPSQQFWCGAGHRRQELAELFAGQIKDA